MPGQRGHIRSLKSRSLGGIIDARDTAKHHKPGTTPSPPHQQRTTAPKSQGYGPQLPLTTASAIWKQLLSASSSALASPGRVGSRSGPQQGSGGAELLSTHPRSPSQIVFHAPKTCPASRLPASLRRPHLLIIFPEKRERSWLLAPSPP